MDQQTKQIDRYGKCPSCNTNWNGGDILENLAKLDTFTGKTKDDLIVIARKSYGYDPEINSKFSLLRAVEVESTVTFQCPVCHQLFFPDGEKV